MSSTESESVSEEAAQAVMVKPKKRRGREPIESVNLECPHCKYIGTSKTGLLNHIRMHLLEVEYTCALCQAKFDSNKKLIEHKIIHEDEKKSYLCRKCEMAFTEHYDWLQHEFDHKQRESHYKCPECTTYFKNKTRAQKHIATHFNLKLKCELCSQIYKTEDQLKLHMNSHDQSFECCECGVIFKRKGSLNYHMLSHTGIKPHQCLYCGLGFVSASAKSIHTRKHTGERPYHCQECDKKFYQQIDMDRHKCTSLVDARKKIDCEVCGKKLFKWSLTGHMRIHNNVKRYKCPECKEAYVSNAALKAHVLYRHSSEKPVKCTEEGCKEAYKTKKDLNRHLFRFHNKDVPYH